MVELSDLPEEIMIEVFKKLDAMSVKNAALVCSDWNRFISTSPAIMKKFLLRVEPAVLSLSKDGNCEEFKQLMSLRRQFTDLDVYIHQNFVESRMTDVVERYGANLNYFKLESAVLDSKVMFEILKHVPELEELNLDFWVPYDRKEMPVADSSLGAVTMKKLKKLTVEEDWNAFQLIEAPALVELITKGSIKNFNAKSFEKFLKACPQLKSLEVYLDLFKEMEPGFPFQLKEIICSYNSFEFNENVKKFLLSQAETVETLEAECDDSKFHEIVLSRFKRLRTLKTNLSQLTATQEFYQQLKPFPFLTELSSFRGFSSEAAAQAVLGNCPELVKLECFGDELLPSQLDFVAEYNKKLEKLSISNIKATNARFQFLKSLILSEAGDTDHLIAFLRANPTVEDFTIGYLDEGGISSEALRVLINETSMKHVQIEGSDSAIKEVYEIIKGGFGTWKTLQLSINDGSTTGMPIYTFEFPENASDWNPPERLGENEAEYHE